MRKGDIVTIQDTSYSRTIVNGKLNEYNRSLRYKQCVVLEVDCVFPKTSPWDGDNHNNTIVQVIDSGKVVFIEECFLSLVPPKHKIMIDVVQCGCVTDLSGPIVEISDKLYREIKRDTQTE